MRKEGHSILSVLPWETKLVSVRVWLPWVSEFGSGACSPAKRDHFPMCPRFCAKHHAYILSVQFSCVRLFVTPWTATCQASLSITNSWSLLKLVSIALVMPSNHLILCCPLPLLPSVFPSIRVFSNEPVLHIRWPKYWSFSISTSNEYSGLISLGLTGWISLLSKGLSSLLQHHISKASLLWRLGFFIVQLSRPYVTTGKSIALTRWTFVDKVMSPFFICYLGWS